MFPERANYNSLKSESLDVESLQYKELRHVDQYVSEDHSFLDSESGTGELIKLEINTFIKFGYRPCLDVLEHIDLKKCKMVLSNIHHIANDLFFFIFTDPDIFEKIKISLGMFPTHLYFHFSYRQKRLIEKAGFEALNVESLDFLLSNDDFFTRKYHFLANPVQ